MGDFEWDEAKNRANIKNHGIDFYDAVSIFDGPTVEDVDDREDYGETRIIAYGQMNGHVVTVVYTMRQDICCMISARKADRNERGAYYETLATRAPHE